VAKHGNRAASSRCGSADVFEAHGVDLEATPDQVVALLKRGNLAFFFAQAWHPSMRHAGPTRRALGLRTAFNLLGPLTNPARPARQLVGVSRPEHTELLAGALGDLGSTRAWVVHGANGLDELSTTGFTKVSEYREGAVKTFYVHPSEAGLPVAVVADLAGGSASENASMLDRLLSGEPGPKRDVVLFNTAAALLIAERVPSLREGVAAAAEAIANGRAAAVLAAMTEARTR
jgi:anthranilate phosphoribosyltransferase